MDDLVVPLAGDGRKRRVDLDSRQVRRAEPPHDVGAGPLSAAHIEHTSERPPQEFQLLGPDMTAVDRPALFDELQAHWRSGAMGGLRHSRSEAVLQRSAFGLLRRAS